MIQTESAFKHSIKINDYLCAGCTSCVRICPTAAIRIRGGKAFITDNKCIDCGECMKHCERKAIYIKQDDFQLIENYGYRVALVPATFIAQFDDKYKTRQIYACLEKLGFTHIYEVEHSVKFMVDLYKQYMQEHPEIRTFISPFCPAVIRLIQVRFPSLMDNIIKLKSPLKAAALAVQQKLMDQGASKESIGIFYVTPCAAKIASVKDPVSDQDDFIDGVINMDFLYNKVKLLLSNSDQDAKAINHHLTARDVRWPLTGGEACNFEGSPYAIDGLTNVIHFLERLEDDAIDAPGLIEMRLCDEGCVGGVLASQNRFVARKRLENRAETLAKIHSDTSAYDHTEFTEEIAKQMEVPQDIKPRSLYKLDDNFSTAFKMAEEMKKIEKSLPGINCGACGAPTCSALAEDIVRGQTLIDTCIFINRQSQASEDAIHSIWGDKIRKIEIQENK